MNRNFCQLILFLYLSLFGSNAYAISLYDQNVLGDNPTLYLTMDTPGTGHQQDLSNHGLNGNYIFPYPDLTVMPNGDGASDFNGFNQYLEVADADALSVPTTGILTLEAWIRPDTLQFQKQEGTGYVHWLGKGIGAGPSGQQEYAARMYSYTNSENRPNRISGYVFNLQGGLGAGSYFQEPVSVGQWIHVVIVYNTINTSTAYPTGYVKIYKNGVLKDQDALKDYNIIPANGTAPLRVATRDLNSFFQGAIGKVALYNYELNASAIQKHCNSMQ